MKVLLVDDEEDIRTIASLSLKTVGQFETMVAASAEEGIKAAREFDPDVILLDVMMPEMDGLQALREIRADEQLKLKPVIFITAKIQRREIDTYLEAGAIGVIEKPFDPMKLPDEILEILSHI